MQRTLQEINIEIEATKKELENVHGTETEVYARIVGYYRSVRNWNKGKKDEYNQRKMFTAENISSAKTSTPTLSHYEIFIRKTCPNCPPVKDFMSNLEMPGRSIDVDTEEGLAEAAKKGIFASPTVIFYNKEGIETARCHNVEELEAVFNKVPVLS